MFQHFGQRLKRDLKQLVDRRLDQSAVLSGSAIKASLNVAQLRLANPPPSHLVSTLMSFHISARDTPFGLVDPSSHHWYVPQTLAYPRHLTCPFSPSSIRRATPKHNTTRLVPVSAVATKSLAVRHKLLRLGNVLFSKQSSHPFHSIYEAPSHTKQEYSLARLPTQLEQLHWNPSIFLSPKPQYLCSSFSSLLSSSSSSDSSPPHGSNGLQAILCKPTRYWSLHAKR
jgi:hypothetical protein